ncbi:MAG: AMP-binding protein [Phycisphaerae bacterium]|jgi:long-chain acyl-CoA synthetase
MHPLLDAFERSVEQRPQRTAVADQSLVLEYRGLRAAACGLARQVQQQTQRTQVGILAPSSAAGAAAILACWYAGRVPVPLNFLLSPAELARVVENAEIDVVLTVPPFVPAAEAAGLRPLVLSATTLAPDDLATPQGLGGDDAVILYTSGTSGAPKGVCLTFDNLVRNAEACIAHSRIEPDCVWLSLLPQFHAFGLTSLTVTPLLLGVTVHYLPRFSPVAVAALVAEKQVNVLIAVPSMFAAITNLKDMLAETFRSLTYTVSGGEPLPERVFNAFRERFGVTLYEGYGMTELSPVVTLNTPWGHRRGSVGQPLPGVNVTAVDSTGAPLPAGEIGELVVRGHCVMRGYFHQPALTVATIRDGGLWTGDLGRVDADGFVYITGRAKDMIIVGGENVYPSEIEQVLAQHPAVREAAVIGVHDAVRGELPAAFVVLQEGAATAEAELRAFCRDRLAGYKTPRWVQIVRDLPRSPTGKLLKGALTLEPG